MAIGQDGPIIQCICETWNNWCSLHQCRITKTVETPTTCDTTTLRQDIHKRLGEISVQLKILHWNQSDKKEPKFLLTKIKIYRIWMM